MKILLVEDMPTLRRHYIRAIKEYDENIEIIEPKCFLDLKTDLLASEFDGAIVDNDLSHWDDSYLFDSNINGEKVCQLIKMTNLFSNKSRIILYSAEALYVKSNLFVVKEKLIGANVIDRFQNEIVSEIILPFDLASPPRYSDFINYCKPKQFQYYKSVLEKIDVAKRFELLANNFSWSSDLKNENGEIYIGHPFLNVKTDQKFYELCDYKRLDSLTSENKQITNVFWNFNKLEYFLQQKSEFLNTYFDNKFIREFFTITYSLSMAKQLLNNKSNSRFNDILKILANDGGVVIRETQCYIINEMIKNGDGETEIKKALGPIQSSLGIEIVDFFDGQLVEFEDDNAVIKLCSKLNSSRFFIKKIDYQKLKSNGINYKGEKFNCCVSDNNTDNEIDIKVYFEPKN